MDRTDRNKIQEWMVRLADGDRRAFEPLFRALLPVLGAFTGRLLGDPAEAQDAAQEALIAVFRRAGEFDPERDALSWIYGIAAYRCKTVRKKHVRRREISCRTQDLEAVRAAWAGPEEDLLWQERISAAAGAFDDLSPMDREAIRAAFGEGPRPKIPAATFRKRLERALRRLRIAGRFRYGSK